MIDTMCQETLCFASIEGYLISEPEADTGHTL